MHGCIVMVIALAGLGGHNPPENLSQTLPAASPLPAPDTSPLPQYAAPTSYSEYYAKASAYPSRAGGYESPEYTTHWGAIRSTLWSLILGRDPDVPTPAEIEASVYGDPASR
jgi:hypothetical protein